MMRPFSLTELAAALDAQRLGGDCEITGVCTDSRTISSGDLFVALRGEHFDGHDYLASAVAGGAVAALVSRPVAVDIPLLQVSDTLRGLGRLGAYNRQLFSKPLVAVTGSSGKTTTKNMLASVLSQRGETLATKANFNNEIGVPLTLLELRAGVDFAVVEMGAARPGDIADLVSISGPNVAILLNAMPAHLAGFGDIESVAQAKGEIFDGLGAADFAVINADQPWASQWRRRAGSATVLDFGLQEPAAISAGHIRNRGLDGVSFVASTPAGDIPVLLALPGVHNIGNALAAIAAALILGMTPGEIRAGLATVRPVEGRMRSATAASGVVVIDDCYNANPGSVRAAIDVLSACGGRRTLILGAMKELGEHSAAWHREIGLDAREAGIEQFWGVGAELEAAVQAFGEGGQYFSDLCSAAEAAPAAFGAGDQVLIKGSHSTGMDAVLRALLPAEVMVAR